MTKQETIRMLQSIEDRAVDFPYMTACDWVAIAAAKRHLENSLEVEEVDLEKEVDSQMDLLCNLLCYMDELSNGDSEGVYPLPENVIEDLQRFAKYFYELGLNAKGD